MLEIKSTATEMNGAFNGHISRLPQPRRESMNLIETAQTKTARDESEPDKHGLQEALGQPQMGHPQRQRAEPKVLLKIIAGSFPK